MLGPAHFHLPLLALLGRGFRHTSGAIHHVHRRVWARHWLLAAAHTALHYLPLLLLIKQLPLLLLIKQLPLLLLIKHLPLLHLPLLHLRVVPQLAAILLLKLVTHLLLLLLKRLHTGITLYLLVQHSQLLQLLRVWLAPL